jgi:hypothetical protein
VKNALLNTCASRLRLNNGIQSGDRLTQNGIKLKGQRQESNTEVRTLTTALDSTTGENAGGDKGLSASRFIVECGPPSYARVSERPPEP